jgi:hypothetical protein
MLAYDKYAFRPAQDQRRRAHCGARHRASRDTSAADDTLLIDDTALPLVPAT